MRLYTIPGVQGFADVYGAGSYGECAYDEASTCSNTSNPGGGTLDNTGIMIGLIVGVAALLLLVVVLVRFWRRPAKLAEEPVEADDDADITDDTTPRT